MKLTDAEEAQLLGLQIPRPLTPTQVQTFMDRWNRTVDYWTANITNAAGVPAGANPDFIDLDLLSASLTTVDTANKQSIGDGFESPFSELTSDVQGAQSTMDDTIKQAGVCASVKVELDQTAVLSRGGFKATLAIDNSGSEPITGLAITVAVEDQFGNDATSLFGIGAPALTNLSDVGGTGAIAAGSTGSAVWTLVPSDAAAPDGPTSYFVKATLSYILQGTPVSIPVIPAGIQVLPNPSLSLKYFWSRDVFADDPFTPQIEPSEPFAVGLLMSNSGAGVANAVTVTSAQPKIVDNEKGLAINFELIGSEVNTQKVTPSLTANLGDIGPGQTAVAEWLMVSSLRGTFTAYDASFEHHNALGVEQSSVIHDIEIHQLLHPVRATTPSDDGKPDFLANDNLDLEHTQATLFSSDGTTTFVPQLFDQALVDGQASTTNGTVHLTVAAPPPGYVYIRTDDPGPGLQLEHVFRSDGSEVRLYDNAWTTNRTIEIEGQAPEVQQRIHIFDKDSTGSYTLVYAGATSDPWACAPPVLDGEPCDDGNPCTTNDACSGGICVGGIGLVCPAPDQCHDGGTCDPTTGLCSSVAKANGTACNDGNACTVGDTCQAGICAGGSFQTCPADQCHVAGVCDPVLGRCNNAPQPDGTACDDGNACTRTDTCQTGVCTGGNPVVCTGGDACHVAACDPPTGSCVSTNRPEGTSCSDGLACNGVESCHGGACVSEGAVVCDDGNPCTADACVEPGTCTASPVADGTPCTTGGFGGQCAHGTCNTGQPDFALVLAPTSLTIPQQGTGSTAVVVTPINAFADAVSFSATTPAGVTASFIPAFISATGTATMTVHVDSPPPGGYPITVTGTSPSASHTATLALTVTPAGSPVYQIAAGAATATPPFQADQFFTGGGNAGTGQTIDTTGVINPAPEAVYQTARFGNFSYSFPGLTAGSTYAVRLHFADGYTNFMSERVFDVLVNGAKVLSRFDVIAAAGGNFKAVVEQFNATADASGRISVEIDSLVGAAILSGVEVVSGGLVPSAPYGLRAVAGNGQVTLSWIAGAGASSYNVYRGTAAGAETLYQTGVTDATFTDGAATNGTKYFYFVTARNDVGDGSGSAEASATPTAGAAPVYQINCGSNVAVSPFQADQYFTGGGTAGTGASIDTTSVASPAPQAVYQSIRFGDFSYLFPGLTPGAPYTVRLHFEESFTNFIGERVFDVAINGSKVLPGFDILAASLATGKAVVEQLDTAADASGQISLQLTGTRGGSILSGIEILTGSAIASAPYGLRAVAGNGQVTLSWIGGAGATSFNVYRGTTAGTEALYQAGVTGPSFVDSAASNGTAYFYKVTAVNDAGEGSASSEASATPTTGPAPVYQIRCGSNVAAPPYQQDQYFTGGGTTGTGQTIDVSGVANPAPQAVYQTIRFGDFSYAFPNLTPGAPYTVRLHFEESFTNFIGERVFDLTVNGVKAFPSFDILAATGATGKAVVEQVNVTADAGGNISLQTTSLRGGAILSGIEILTGSAAPSAPYGLRAVAGNGQVALTWLGAAGASRFNVYRGTTPGSEALYQAGVMSPAFVDGAAANGTTYYYTVTAADAAGEGAMSNEASATPTTGPAPVYRIRCGSNIPAPPYQQDQYFTGGGTAGTGQTIDTSGVVDPAPQAVYQTIRDGDFSYLFPGLTAGATYTVRLHFAESFTNFIGDRVFNVALNGAQVLSNFDIIAVAGGTEKAVVEQFDTTADAGGDITLQVTTLTGGAILSGIEVLTGAAIPSAPFGLRAVPGDGKVTLTWPTETGATSYNVYRGTAPGAEGLYHAGVGTPSFVDDAAANGTTYFYTVTALNDAGESAASNEATATPTPGPAPVYRVACGSTTDVPPFQLDQYFSSGGTASTGSAIDTTAVVNPAPQAVYQKVRYGNFTYAFPGLVPGAPYTVRLHFAESFTNLVGVRVFDLAINGTAALSAFDVIFAAGHPEKAIVEQFNAAADGSGQITLQFSSTMNGGIVSGIEILTGSAIPSAPWGLQAQPGDNQATLSWQAGAGATSFDVYRGTAPGAEALYQTGVTSPSFADTGATNGTRYFYTVTALNGVGEGAPSAEASVTPAPPSCQAPLFAEFWDLGTSGWRAVDTNPITILNDAACGPFQRESVFGSGGRVFTQAGIPVSAGASYCLTSWIRGGSGASPFLGIQLSDINGNLAGTEHWLIGQASYPTGYGDTVTPVTSTGDWAWYAKAFTMETGATAVVVKDENNGGGTADFDTIELIPGACPAPPAAACAAPATNCP